jgi:hypothetical protein
VRISSPGSKYDFGLRDAKNDNKRRDDNMAKRCGGRLLRFDHSRVFGFQSARNQRKQENEASPRAPVDLSEFRFCTRSSAVIPSLLRPHASAAA